MNRPQAVVYAAVVGAFAGLLWLTEHRFDQSLDALDEERTAQAMRSCEAGDETRQILRQIVRDGGIASGTAGGEALIATATDADPEDIAAYRQHLTEQLGPALTDIVNQLPGRAWDPKTGECIEVEVGG